MRTSHRLSIALIAGALLIIAAPVSQAITIGYFDGSRSTRPFDGSNYDNIRGQLLDPANFGPGGTVTESITIAPGISTATPAALSGFDVFIMSEVPSLSAAEITALQGFLAAGGDFLIVSDSGTSEAGMNGFLATIDGSSLGGNTSGVPVSVIGGNGADGLFGPVGAISNTPYRILNPGSVLTVTGTTPGGPIMGEILPGELGAGSGGFLISGDVLFMDFFVPPGSIVSDQDNANYFLNWFTDTVVAPPAGVVPEPATATLGLLAMFGLVGSRSRRRQMDA